VGQVRYTFVASGQQTVANAFKSIDKAAAGAARAVGRLDKKAEQLGRSMSKAMSKVGEKMDQTLTRAHSAEAERLAMLNQAVRESASKQIRSIEKVAQARTRAARKGTTAERAAARKRVAIERRADAKVTAARRKSGALGRVGRTLISGVAVTGLFAGLGAAGAGIRQVAQLHDLANKISIAAHVKPGEAPIAPEKITGQIRSSVRKAPGVSSVELAKAMDLFIQRTGRGDLTLQLSDQMAKFMLATGTKGEATGATAGTLHEAFGLSTPKEMEKAFAAINMIAKRGSFEPKDVAANLAKFAPMFESAGAKSDVNALNSLLGMSQFTAKVVGGTGADVGARTATAMSSFFTALIKKQGKIKKETGLDVGSVLRERPNELVPALLKAFKGNAEKLFKIFPKRGIGAILTAGNMFDELKRKGYSEADAMDKIIAKYNKMSDTTGAVTLQNQDAAQASKSFSARLTAAWEKLTAKIEGPVLRGLEKLTTVLPDLITNLGPFIEALGELLPLLGDLAGAIAAITDPLGLKAEARSRGKAIREAEARQKDAKTKLANLKSERAGATGKKAAALDEQVKKQEVVVQKAQQRMQQVVQAPGEKDLGGGRKLVAAEPKPLEVERKQRVQALFMAGGAKGGAGAIAGDLQGHPMTPTKKAQGGGLEKAELMLMAAIKKFAAATDAAGASFKAKVEATNVPHALPDG